MSSVPRNLVRLVDLAREPSSDKRRELLREMTDLFMEAPASYDERQADQFGDILGAVARDMEMAVRQNLAARMASVPNAPRNLIIQLANDEIDVARPVLTQSLVLKDADLVALAKLKGQGHLHAVAGRGLLSTAVSDALVARGDDNVLVRLAANAGARMSRSSLETLTDRAQNSEALQAPLVSRADLPPDLMNAMFFAVSSELKRTIMTRMKDVEPSLIDDAIRLTERKMKRVAGAPDAEQIRADAFLASLARTGPVTEAVLHSLAKQKRFNDMVTVLAKLAALDLKTARRVCEDPNPEALAIACRACRFDRQTFATLVLCREQEGGQTKSLGEAYDLLRLYDQVPVETAQRVMRFWRLRQSSGEAAAA